MVRSCSRGLLCNNALVNAETTIIIITIYIIFEIAPVINNIINCGKTFYIKQDGSVTGVVFWFGRTLCLCYGDYCCMVVYVQCVVL